MAIVAIVALAPGQVLAESVEEPEEVVCAGLGSLTMHVNTVTLHKQETLTKQTSSSDGLCTLTMTLIDASSEDNPADKTKSCKVSVSPAVSNDGPIDITPSESGDCDTVDYVVDLDFAHGGSNQNVWAAHPNATEPATKETPESGFVGASGCFYTARAEYAHRSGRDVSTHGWWYSPRGSGCPDKARVSVWLQGHRCAYGNQVCWWQTVKFKREHIGPKNITGRRVTPRRACATYVQTGYRTVTTVRPDGNNGYKTTYSIPVNVFCRT